MALSKAEAFSELDASRARLLEILEDLTEEQWNHPSLSDGWRVRDVVSHIASGSTMKTSRFMKKMARNKFNFNKAMDQLTKESGARPIPEILEHFRGEIGSRKLPATVSARQFLVDCVTHSLDICWPLGIELNVAPRQMSEVLDKAVSLGDPFLCRERAEGLRLVAPEIEWSHGAGPEVRGPAEAILLAIAGREAGLEHTEGDGIEVLRSRL